MCIVDFTRPPFVCRINSFKKSILGWLSILVCKPGTVKKSAFRETIRQKKLARRRRFPQHSAVPRHIAQPLQ
jgi:hypothetical protein